MNYSASSENPDIEVMVDDFASFYFAGKCHQLLNVHANFYEIIFFIGQETTANTITFALILLVQHPNIMER